MVIYFWNYHTRWDMYNISISVPQINNVEFYQKMYEISLCKNKGYKMALFIKENTYGEDQRYRIKNMEEVINDSQKWIAVDIEKANIELVKKILNYFDLVVLVRLLFFDPLKEIVKQCNEKRIPAIYEIDDLVFDIKSIEDVKNGTAVYNDAYWNKQIEEIDEAAKLCDGYWSTNEYLTWCLVQKYDKPGFTFKNFLNKEQCAVSTECLRQKNRYIDKFMVGYFSGSKSHQNDFKIVEQQIIALMKKYDNFYLKIVGYLELSDEMNQYVKNGRVILKNITDYITLQTEIAEVDVNIAPLTINKFTNCKSELKYFEAAVVGTISCCSPTFVYRKAIENGKNGFLCENDEWGKTLEKIYINRKNMQEKMKYISRNALEKYAFYNLEDDLIELLEQMRTIV